MIDREQAIQAARRIGVEPCASAARVVDAILALPDPERVAVARTARSWADQANKAEAELARLRPVVEAARRLREAGTLDHLPSWRDPWQELTAALDALDGEQ